jgi:hypothetical protein
MSKSFSDAVTEELKAQAISDDPELTPEQKIALGLQQNEDNLMAELGNEVDGLSEIAKKAALYKTGNNAATALEFGRAEKNRKVILGLKAKYQPVRDALGERYVRHFIGREATDFWKRVQKHLVIMDDIFNV